jgi:hypothetical protein
VRRPPRRPRNRGGFGRRLGSAGGPYHRVGGAIPGAVEP